MLGGIFLPKYADQKWYDRIGMDTIVSYNLRNS